MKKKMLERPTKKNIAGENCASTVIMQWEEKSVERIKDLGHSDIDGKKRIWIYENKQILLYKSVMLKNIGHRNSVP